ncbi:hypothetical protein EBU71_00085 [bacterium]|nr:hypothetical protein [Candidatus Elulimicrobium humile]
MDWTYNDQPFVDAKGWFGFIYEITCIPTGKKYIGRKYFTSAKTKQPLKGRVNKRRSRVENDWKDYWGSSNVLLADIEKYGKNLFKREIIRLCKTRGEVNYWEAKLQFEADVLNARLENGEFSYYNENIMMKFTRKNIGKLK